MTKQDTMKPVDLVVALALAANRSDPTPTYSQLGQMLGLSASTTFGAVKHLRHSGLLHPGSHDPNKRELMNFLVHGVKHAFPPLLGREAKGVPTAHAGPVLKELFDGAKPVVWPDAHGAIRGTGMTPLYPKATELPKRNPEVYELLTLVDAIRGGQARERNAAIAALGKVLGRDGD